ncbi:delta-lactam-biosynthetic de-N-acetylase [Alkalicoccobacillus porphyridii]|uniref:Delta-lactam-biosynthetic de-N-acetylase n=1 Tax=Alkalicoccobacillus porphyridii TaxID=2597270 RepID=A0A553ZUN4_9BACI|nr:delta-lactam-biosynthetic de-N-acetylase [Alkalicoccobacillus porphyridii]TSB45208.1 delta-lactam-biosynthetic de-N-acetylase [Alkalicoccobacillus porphyridii]
MKWKQILFIIVLFCLSFLPNNATAETMNNDVLHWSFKPSKNEEPATTEPEFLRLLQNAGGYFIGDTERKVLYLTFDNGYENGYTEKVLDVLKEKEVPAAFFVTGHYLDSAPELVKRMVAEGHIVGNHSWHHPSLPAIDDERLARELVKVKKRFTELTGVDYMSYLRPPRGEFSERSLELSEAEGYINVFWSLAYADWDVNKQKGADYAYEKIMSRIHPGAIMLLHSVSSDNAEALPRVIDEAKKQGYCFESLDELVSSDVLP